MLNPFYRLIHTYPMQINRFKPIILMPNRFDCVNLQYTMQINQLIPVLFIVNRFDMLKHQYTVHINLFKQV